MPSGLLRWLSYQRTAGQAGESPKCRLQRRQAAVCSCGRILAIMFCPQKPVPKICKRSLVACADHPATPRRLKVRSLLKSRQQQNCPVHCARSSPTKSNTPGQAFDSGVILCHPSQADPRFYFGKDPGFNAWCVIRSVVVFFGGGSSCGFLRFFFSIAGSVHKGAGQSWSQFQELL